MPAVIAALLRGESLFAAPYASYTYDFYGNAVPAPQAYTAQGIIDGASLGISPLREPRDLAVSPGGEIYIADTGNNRILRLSSSFELIQVIDGFWRESGWDTFSAPVALYVTERGRLYVADRDNARLVELTADGTFVRIIGLPKRISRARCRRTSTTAPFRSRWTRAGASMS